jgi:hypothetical protein
MAVDPTIPPSSNPDDRQNQRLAQLERKVRALEALVAGGANQIAVVTALPTAGRQGRIVVLTSDHKLYVDTGSAWAAQT